MFTGLVEETGQLSARTPRPPSARIEIRCGLTNLELGESISVDGVCLTVDKVCPGTGFEVDASAETLARTTLGTLPLGARINLERAVAMGQRLGGHIVSGHVDGVGEVTERTDAGNATRVVFRAPKELLRFIAEKGSITVSGVSLTVNGVDGDHFEVMLIPHTLGKTSLGTLRVGDTVNLEVDVLARYVARLLESSPAPNSHADANAEWMARLERAGLL
jgi:riboflavin synthase